MENADVNQKLSWSLLICGLGLFMFQFGDLLVSYSDWTTVLQPAGVGEILRTLGGVALAVMGALGIKLGKQ